MAAKIKQSPKMPAEKRRHQLLAAAKKLFTKKGYRGTTTEEIARRARLTKGALYHHFKSKEDILLALLHDKFCEYDEIMERICTPGASPLELLTGLFSLHPKKDLSDFRNMIDLWVQAMRIPKVKKELDAYIDEAISAFAESLDPRYGAEPATRRQVAILVGVIYDGLAVRKCMNPASVDIPSQLALVARFQDSLADSPTAPKRKRSGDTKK